jgi:hypothetical protein
MCVLVSTRFHVHEASTCTLHGSQIVVSHNSNYPRLQHMIIFHTAPADMGHQTPTIRGHVKGIHTSMHMATLFSSYVLHAHLTGNQWAYPIVIGTMNCASLVNHFPCIDRCHHRCMASQLSDTSSLLVWGGTVFECGSCVHETHPVFTLLLISRAHLPILSGSDSALLVVFIMW